MEMNMAVVAPKTTEVKAEVAPVKPAAKAKKIAAPELKK